MSAPILGIGEAFRGFVDSERQRRDLRDAAAGAAQMFRDVGTPESAQYAEMFLSNPRAAFLMAEQAGGVKQLYAIAQEQAARGRITKATEGLDPGSPDYFSALAGATAADDPRTAAAYYDLAKPEAEAKPILREFKVGDRIVTRQFDPASRTWVDLENAPRFAPEKRRAVYGPNGELIYTEGNVSQTQINRAKELGSRSQALDNAISLYPVVRDNPALHARSGVGQEAATAVATVAPSAGAPVREALTGGASAEELALYNVTTQQAQGVAARLLNGGGGQLSEGDAKRARLMLSQQSDPTTFRLALRAQIVGSIRAANYEARNTGERPDYDIRNEEDLRRLRDTLLRKGFKPDEVRAVLEEVREPMPGWWKQ